MEDGRNTFEQRSSVFLGCISEGCLEVKREYYQNCSMLGCVTSNVSPLSVTKAT